MAEEQSNQIPESASPDVSALQAQLAAEQAERQRLAQEHQMAMGYLQQMTAMVQQQHQAQQTPPPPVVADDDLFVQNPKKFREDVIREATQQAEQIVQQRVAPAAQMIALERITEHRDRAVADPSMPKFAQWEKEIYQLLAPAGVDHAINYKNWKQAYNIIAAQHLDELVDERVAQRRQHADEDDDVMADAGEAPAAPRRVVAPGPISTGSRGQPPSPAAARKPPALTPMEKLYAQRAGMTAQEFAHYRDNESEDVFGFNGRDKI
jgi:hypothetical protein